MSVKEINPKETTRATAFDLWMKAPNPMVTFFDGDRALLPISFQFHNTQMDGAHAGIFLRNMEEEISKFQVQRGKTQCTHKPH